MKTFNVHLLINSQLNIDETLTKHLWIQKIKWECLKREQFYKTTNTHNLHIKLNLKIFNKLLYTYTLMKHCNSIKYTPARQTNIEVKII